LVGTIARFRIHIPDIMMQGLEIVRGRPTTSTATVTGSAHGTIRSIQRTIQHL